MSTTSSAYPSVAIAYSFRSGPQRNIRFPADV